MSTQHNVSYTDEWLLKMAEKENKAYIGVDEFLLADETTETPTAERLAQPEAVAFRGTATVTIEEVIRIYEPMAAAQRGSIMETILGAIMSSARNERLERIIALFFSEKLIESELGFRTESSKLRDLRLRSLCEDDVRLGEIYRLLDQLEAALDTSGEESLRPLHPHAGKPGDIAENWAMRANRLIKEKQYGLKENIRGDSGRDYAAKWSFGKFVELSRLKRKLSRESFAEQAHIPVEEVVFIEETKNFAAHKETVYCIADFLRVPREELSAMAGVDFIRDDELAEATLRFVAQAQPIRSLSFEENAALEELEMFLRQHPR